MKNDGKDCGLLSVTANFAEILSPKYTVEDIEVALIFCVEDSEPL